MAQQRSAMLLTRIVSGGQTGVDRAALDAALAANFPCGGWAPGDRMAEEGVIPARYPLVPLVGGGYKARTRKNVQDSDGTAVIFNETLTGGTKLTRDLCVRERKPFVLLDGAQIPVERAVAAVLRFVDDNEIGVLNVAGPRASGWAEGHGFALAVMGELIGVLGN